MITEKIIPFGLSGLLAISAVIAEAGDKISLLTSEGWFQLAVQAGMTFIVAIIFLKFLPDQVKAQRELLQSAYDAIEKNNQANLGAIKVLTDAFKQHDEAWRTLLTNRGWCPVRDPHPPVVVLPPTSEQGHRMPSPVQSAVSDHSFDAGHPNH